MRQRHDLPERRRYQRGTTTTEPRRDQLVAMILGTFREMPGLCLHMSQAARLFGISPATCQVIFDDLVAQGTLRRAADGQFVGAQLDRPRAAHIPGAALPPDVPSRHGH